MLWGLGNEATGSRSFKSIPLSLSKGREFRHQILELPAEFEGFPRSLPEDLP